MNLQLNNDEIKTLKRALINWNIVIQHKTKEIQLKGIWDVFSKEMDITEQILKKILENENIN